MDRGVGWANSYFSGDQPLDRRHFQWGFRTGYKWRFADSMGLITNYVMQSNPLRGWHNQPIGEVALEWRLSERLAIGPGVMFTLDGGRQTPNVGTGVKIRYAFN